MSTTLPNGVPARDRFQRRLNSTSRTRSSGTEVVGAVAAHDFARERTAGDGELRQSDARPRRRRPRRRRRRGRQRVDVVDRAGDLAEDLEPGSTSTSPSGPPASAPAGRGSRRNGMASPRPGPTYSYTTPLRGGAGAAVVALALGARARSGRGRPRRRPARRDEDGDRDAGLDRVAAGIQDERTGGVERRPAAAPETEHVVVAGGGDRVDVVRAQADVDGRAQRVGLAEHADAELAARLAVGPRPDRGRRPSPAACA